MGNLSQKENKIHKKHGKTQSLSKHIICLTISYWSRTVGLPTISCEYLTSNIVITIIEDFSKPSFCVEIAEKILSMTTLTTKQITKYMQQKRTKLQNIIEKDVIFRLCDEIIPILEHDNILLKLNIQKNIDQKLIIIGDIRGDLLSLLKHFDSIRNNDNICKYENIIDKIYKYNDIYLFLGSYVS
eukprot:316253_1